MNSILVVLISLFVIVAVQVGIIITYVKTYRKIAIDRNKGTITYIFHPDEAKFRRIGWKNFYDDRPANNFLRRFSTYDWFDFNQFLKNFNLANSLKIKENFNKVVENSTNIRLNIFAKDRNKYTLNIYNYNKEENKVYFDISWNDFLQTESNVKSFIKSSDTLKSPYLAIFPLNLKNKYLTNFNLLNEDLLRKVKSKSQIYFYEDDDLVYLIINAKDEKKLSVIIKNFLLKNSEFIFRAIRSLAIDELNYYKAKIDFKNFNIQKLINDAKQNIINVVYQHDGEKRMFFNKLIFKKQVDIEQIFTLKNRKVNSIYNNSSLGEFITYKINDEYQIVKDWTLINDRIEKQILNQLINTKSQTNRFILIHDYHLDYWLTQKKYSNITFVVSFRYFNKKSIKLVEKLLKKGNSVALFVDTIDKRFNKVFLELNFDYLILSKDFSVIDSTQKLSFTLNISSIAKEKETIIIYEKINLTQNEKLLIDLNANYVIKN